MRNKKSRGRNWKRAEDAMKRIHLSRFSDYDKGYVVNASKAHPNYFTAYLHNKFEDTWDIHFCAYISTYYFYDKEGNHQWVPLLHLK